jgi:cyanate permease
MINKLQWFAHERPLYIALYGVSLGASGKLAPVFSAFINSGMGWEWTLVSVYP